jgi:hypothetical protein
MRRRNQDHHRARHSDDLVELVRVLNDNGMGYHYLCYLFNLPLATVRDWCTYRTRGAA